MGKWYGKIKKPILASFCLLFIILLILYSNTSVKSGLEGLNLWLNIVIPSLFPFMTASYLLVKSGLVKIAGNIMEPLMRPVFNVPGSSSFAFIIGIASGYPLGAKITSRLWKDKLISTSEAERVLAFSNNCGPLFIIGSVAAGMLHNQRAGYILLTSHILAGLSVGILLNLLSRKKRNPHTPDINKNMIIRKTSKGESFGTLLKDAVLSSVNTLLLIGGFIILFSVIISILTQTGIISSIAYILSPLASFLGIGNELLISAISGFFEITSGTRMISGLTTIPILHKLPALSLIIGWAGLSVHSQVLGILAGTNLKMGIYIIGKFLHGAISAFYTFLILKFTDITYLKPIPASGHLGDNMSKIQQHTYITLGKYITIILLLLTAIIILSRKFHQNRKLF